MITLYIIVSFLVGLGVIPIYVFLKKRKTQQKIEKIKNVDNVADAVRETLPLHHICPFGVPCLVYDEKHTREAFERVLKLMKDNIKEKIDPDPK